VWLSPPTSLVHVSAKLLSSNVCLSLGGQQYCNVHTILCENWSTCSKVEKADGHACAHKHTHMHREHYEYHTFTFFLERTESILQTFIVILLLCVSQTNVRNHNPVTS
jgi:hypothetical protein